MVGAGWAEARPGSWAVDHRLTGIWGHWCQSFPSACRAEAWWVLGAGTLLDTLGWGQGVASRPLFQVLNLLGQVRGGREPGEAALQESLRVDPERTGDQAVCRAQGQDPGKGGLSSRGKRWALRPGRWVLGLEPSCARLLRVHRPRGPGVGTGRWESRHTRKAAGVHDCEVPTFFLDTGPYGKLLSKSVNGVGSGGFLFPQSWVGGLGASCCGAGLLGFAHGKGLGFGVATLGGSEHGQSMGRAGLARPVAASRKAGTNLEKERAGPWPR